MSNVTQCLKRTNIDNNITEKNLINT